MRSFQAKVSLLSALLLCTNAQSVYNRADTPSYSESETPKFSIIEIERRAEADPRDERQILIFDVPRLHKIPHSRSQLVSLENVVSPQSAGAQSPAYVVPAAFPPQSPYEPSAAPTWNYQKPDRPYYVAIEDVQTPTQQRHDGNHFALFDVNLPAPPAIIINSYPKGAVPVESPVNPIRYNLAPAIDARFLKPSQKPHNVDNETKHPNTEIKFTTEKIAPTTQDSDPNRSSRSAEDVDPVIIFPKSSDDTDESNDDSVEILAPPDRLRRNVISLENVVGPGQIGYPVYRHPQQPVVVTQTYRYPQQPVVLQTYPQQPAVVQTYPQQYAGRQPYLVGDLCPWGSCYRHG